MLGCSMEVTALQECLQNQIVKSSCNKEKRGGHMSPWVSGSQPVGLNTFETE